jgi:tRNA-binding protein
MSPTTFDTIDWADFDKVQICVGTILTVEDLLSARKPAFVLTIDFGPHGVMRSSAQITTHYTKDMLIGRQVVAVINFPEKQVGSVVSQCLVTGFADANGDIVLTAVERTVPNGGRLY